METPIFYYLTFYHFVAIEDPALEVKRHKDFFKNLNIKSRIYIAKDGINAVLSAPAEEAERYMEWMKADPRFNSVWFKIHKGSEHSLPHQTVKQRKQLVALDVAIDHKDTGAYLTPEQWASFIEKRDENTLIIDVRNNYESAVGYFEGAERPDLKTFRQFPQYTKDLAKKYDPKKTKVMTYCTGGIRCELYTALLKNEGFEQVYQLHGGVVHYGETLGSKHWKGKLFMFDDRLAIPLEQKETAPVGSCHHCHTASDRLCNCAHMACNELFISCPSCAEKFEGCCSESCQKQEHRRPFVALENPKPFRRLNGAQPSERPRKRGMNACCSLHR